MALTYTPNANLGLKLPEFLLPSVDGQSFSHQDFIDAPALAVMFICNHCPYVLAIEDRLIDLAVRLQPEGAKFLAVCANDPSDYPEDAPAELLKRSRQKKYPFTYLHDAEQVVTKKFGAVCTPDLFLFDKNQMLVYRGRLDDSWKDASKVTSRDFENAIVSVLNGENVAAQQSPAMGCSIKFYNTP